MTIGSDPIEESYTFVTSQRRNRKNKKKVQILGVNIKVSSQEESDFDPNRVIKRIQEAKNDLQPSIYYKNTVDKLKSLLTQYSKPIKRLICIGIGHFSDCVISRHQLAFVLLIKEQFDISSIDFHEPILTRGEITTLKHLNCSIKAENLEGKIGIEQGTTIVYAPHCPKQLINNFLWKNWNRNRLEELIYIGNSFTNLLNSTPSRFLATDAEYIVEIQSYCEEISLVNNFKFTDIFNDTSLHCFPKNTLKELNEKFWTNKIEPIYQSDSLELVTVQLVEKLQI